MTRILALALLVATACGGRERRPPVAIAAAASLRHVMPELIDAYQRQPGGHRIVVSFGATDDLAELVRTGAAFDGVVMAEPDPVSRLVEAGLVDEASQRPLASNQIVLVSREDRAARFATLAADAAIARIGLGQPQTVPAGRYAERYLRGLDAWERIKPRAVYGGDVAAVLAMVVRGDVDAAIVYRTDARSAPGISVLDEAAGPHAPVITIVAGVVARRPRAAAARAFFDFAASPAGQQIFARHGFGPP